MSVKKILSYTQGDELYMLFISPAEDWQKQKNHSKNASRNTGKLIKSSVLYCILYMYFTCIKYKIIRLYGLCVCSGIVDTLIL